MRLFLAFRVFFAVLFGSSTLASLVRALLDGGAPDSTMPASALGSATNGPSTSANPSVSAPLTAPGTAATTATSSAEKPLKQAATKSAPTGHRSDALTLISLFQREARLIDFLMEPIGEYTDEQVGAAARTVHSECGKTLTRVFGLTPVLADCEEGARIPISSGLDAAAIRLVGDATPGSAANGVLRHPGWKATHCDLPTWTGAKGAEWIVAPAEVEVAR